jgi:CBS domain-containing protein
MGVFNVLRGNFIGGMWWSVLGLFLQGAAKMSYQRLVTRKALEGESVRRFMRSEPVTVKPNISLKALVEDYVYRYHFKMFPVVEDGNRLVGCITTKDVKELPREEWDRKTVGEVAERCTPENTIDPEKDATEALSMMNRNGTSRLMVVEEGRLKGIIALKDMLKFLSLKVELDNPS